MKHSIVRKGLAAMGALCVFSLTVAAASVVDVTVKEQRALDGGATLTLSNGTAGERPQVMYTVEADPSQYEFLIGGTVSGRDLVQNAAPLTDREVEAVAAVNGDHFSFKTGIPMGMSISDGEIITSPIPAYNADDYYFHALGIKADGTVVTGENPTLYMQYTVGEHTCSIERINRTRENWEGGQICLYTPRYGESTGTDFAGIEFAIRVDEGKVGIGTMKGTVTAIDEDGDMPIEDGHVVLSIHLMRYNEVEMLHVGDELEFYFSFEQDVWNEVTFAVGGNLTAVKDGEAQPFDYTVGAFTAAAPRTALGVKADGTLVLAAVDGRSETAGGLTANEMATYLAEGLDCEHAILLDGGGSTAMTVRDDNGEMTTVNVPSEERPVGNSVLLVKKAVTDEENNAGAQEDSGKNETFFEKYAQWLWGGLVLLVAVALAVVMITMALCRPNSKNN